MAVDRYVNNLIIGSGILWMTNEHPGNVGIRFPDGTMMSTTNLIAQTAQSIINSIPTYGNVNVASYLSDQVVVGNLTVNNVIYTSNTIIGNDVIILPPSGALIVNNIVVTGNNILLPSVPSISTTSGAIINAGGEGLGGNINVGGQISLFTGNVGIGTNIPDGISNTLTVFGETAHFGNIFFSNSSANEIGIHYQDGTFQITASLVGPTGPTGPTGLSNSIIAAGTIGEIQFSDGSNNFDADQNLYWDNTNKRLGIGTQLPYADIQFGSAMLESIDSNTTNISPIVIDSFLITEMRSAHYYIQITDETNSEYHVMQIMVVQNGIDTFMTQYNDIYTSTSLGIFTSSIQSNNCLLIFTPESATFKTIKVSRSSMSV